MHSTAFAYCIELRSNNYVAYCLNCKVTSGRCGAWGNACRFCWNWKVGPKGLRTSSFMCEFSRREFYMKYRATQVETTVPKTVQKNWWELEKLKLMQPSKLKWFTGKFINCCNWYCTIHVCVEQGSNLKTSMLIWLQCTARGYSYAYEITKWTSTLQRIVSDKIMHPFFVRYHKGG